MEYSQQAFVAMVRAHPSVMNELEARDVVFRRNFDDQKIREFAPWIMLGRSKLQQEEFDIWGSLHAGELAENEAIEKLTDLMERYYGQPYPLR